MTNSCSAVMRRRASRHDGGCFHLHVTARSCKLFLLLASLLPALARHNLRIERSQEKAKLSLSPTNSEGPQHKSIVMRVLPLLAAQGSFMGTGLSNAWLTSSDRVEVKVFASMSDRNTKEAFTKSIGHVVQALQGSSVMNLHIVPWGASTALSQDGTPLNLTSLRSQDPSLLVFECGPQPSDSCRSNLWHGCLQKRYPDVKKFFPVSLCIIAKACLSDERPPDQCFGPVDDVAASCVGDFGDGLNVTELQRCVNGTEGASVLLQSAAETSELDPSPQFFPWITINGVPLAEMGGKGSEEIRNLGRDVCETYSKDSWKMVDACKGFWESSKMDTAEDGGPTPSVFDGRAKSPENSGAWILFLFINCFIGFISYIFCIPVERPISSSEANLG
ncbi:hypothetical protein GUITHDRAFT_164896 [Guillardia theta CCMP2712]|uniref:Uncharacterized protein n=2 Tax=Guillardia theta TaxID=55529 RepID=L1ITL1_GUITC|nr:hypothetical protein GUITHDRAFT_164896 [Guillardia theta CCMP2712]EKX39573.1 hypothetical protein GUITHDRAFT_164896 [Guillardia theta CCMP2712]|mmetsp:Transcript_13456/g.46847  ORF Transcript_13456/g.46847 Transcript_13456/m.46847 type:complete len:390 (+) Transcript_13456:173-1342(+)|eukprot:XP_005826553.1 hypothetical protein GUITHDRAFT_164896 [Guillardia theta CCMP2712]